MIVILGSFFLITAQVALDVPFAFYFRWFILTVSPPHPNHKLLFQLRQNKLPFYEFPLDQIKFIQL